MSIWEKVTRLMLLWTSADLDDFYALIDVIVTNILEHPNEAKYKELKLNKGAIQKRIMSRVGGIDFIHALGFEMVVKDDVKCLEFNDAFLMELDGSLQWLRDIIASCKSMRTEDSRNEHCAQCVIQIRLPNGSSVLGGFAANDSLSTVASYASTYFTEERRADVQVRLPHKAGTTDLRSTLAELGMVPKGLLVASIQSDEDRVEALQQSHVEVERQMVDSRALEKRAREQRMAMSREREKAKSDVLREFQVDRERHRKPKSEETSHTPDENDTI